MYGFVYDPFAAYERQLDREYLEDLGFDSDEEYQEWKQEQKEDAEMEHFDEYYMNWKGL